MSASVVMVVLAIVAVLVVASVAGAVVVWRRLGSQVSREARLLMAEQTAASPAHQAAIGWRRSLGQSVDQVRRTIDGGRRAGAPMGDLDSLLRHLEWAVSGLDRELELLTVEPDPSVVDAALRTDVGLRAERVLQVAGQIRQAVARSVASGNSATVDDLASSAQLSTTALSAALEELAHRQR